LLFVCGCDTVTAMMHTEIAPELLESFRQIAARHVSSVETLETRNRDSLDFHDVHVEALVLMLAEAYALGQASIEGRLDL
jgi:hypothetical protein